MPKRELTDQEFIDNATTNKFQKWEYQKKHCIAIQIMPAFKYKLIRRLAKAKNNGINTYFNYLNYRIRISSINDNYGNLGPVVIGIIIQINVANTKSVIYRERLLSGGVI